jgi:hypothetical protein|nr:MAG TPA: hypothetical protein [Caudoviricetes sp.]
MFRKGKYIESTSGVIGYVTKISDGFPVYKVLFPKEFYGLTCRVFDKKYYKVIG